MDAEKLFGLFSYLGSDQHRSKKMGEEEQSILDMDIDPKILLSKTAEGNYPLDAMLANCSIALIYEMTKDIKKFPKRQGVVVY